MPRSFDERLRTSFDPLQGRRLLDQIETGARPAARRRRVIAVMRLPRREDFIERKKGETK